MSRNSGVHPICIANPHFGSWGSFVGSIDFTTTVKPIYGAAIHIYAILRVLGVYTSSRLRVSAIVACSTSFLASEGLCKRVLEYHRHRNWSSVWLQEYQLIRKEKKQKHQHLLSRTILTTEATKKINF
jgi:hypothetical protein